MKKSTRILVYSLISAAVLALAGALVLAFWPVEWRIANEGISPGEAEVLRRNFSGPHETFIASDDEVLFLRRWNPDTTKDWNKEVAVLIFHGFTAHSGPYDMAGIPISEGGYTTFGLDYRGHGLSGGNRGDSPDRDQWVSDLVEATRYVKRLGFPKVVVLGHSLGVAAALCNGMAAPRELDGMVLLSGAYEGRKGVSKPLSLFEKSRIISCAIFRPSYRAVEYYREGMTISDDRLWNYRYTPRFVMMFDVKKLRLPEDMNIPVLVGVGDRDELFEVEKVEDFYDLIPGTKKEFLIMKDATHARIPRESWEEVVQWLDKTYGPTL